RVDVPGGGFWIGPGKSNDIVIHEGPIEVFTLKPQANAAVWEREKDKQVATAKIRLANLPANYEYSPANADKRTVYYRITGGRIERVSPEQGRAWRTKEMKQAEAQK